MCFILPGIFFAIVKSPAFKTGQKIYAKSNVRKGGGYWRDSGGFNLLIGGVLRRDISVTVFCH
jgi:hypothetical protein